MRKDIVNAVSKNEEYTNVTSTVFNGAFGNGSACGGDLDKVLEYSRKAVGASRMNDVTVLVLMNSYRSAGTTYMLKPSSSAGYGEGASIAFLPYRNWNSTGYSKNDLTATLIHELVGHGFHFRSGQGQVERFPQGQPLQGREPRCVRRVKRLRFRRVQTEREQYDEVPKHLRTVQRTVTPGDLDPCDEAFRGHVLDSGLRVVRQVGSGPQSDKVSRFTCRVTVPKGTKALYESHWLWSLLGGITERP